jgi:hypothetical protein
MWIVAFQLAAGVKRKWIFGGGGGWFGATSIMYF